MIEFKDRVKNYLLTGLYAIASWIEPKKKISIDEHDKYASLLEDLKSRSKASEETSLYMSEHENVIFLPQHKAVYTSCGKLVKESAISRWRSKQFVSAPLAVDIEDMGSIPTLDTHFFGGVIFDNHFGHFITESLSRLWPTTTSQQTPTASSYPWVFSTSSGKKKLDLDSSFVSQLLSFSRRADLKFRLQASPVRFRRLIIPAAAHRIGISFHKSYRTYCRLAGRDIIRRHGSAGVNRFSGKKIYLSRSKLTKGKRQIIGENELEAWLKCNGFHIVHPEDLPLYEQIMMFESADLIVGCIGSAFHTQIFTSEVPGRVICITDEKPAITYLNFDTMCGNTTQYILGLSRSYFSSKLVKHVVLDTEFVKEVLREFLS